MSDHQTYLFKDMCLLNRTHVHTSSLTGVDVSHNIEPVPNCLLKKYECVTYLQEDVGVLEQLRS